jgi:hypothetical protein
VSGVAGRVAPVRLRASAVLRVRLGGGIPTAAPGAGETLEPGPLAAPQRAHTKEDLRRFSAPPAESGGSVVANSSSRSPMGPSW